MSRSENGPKSKSQEVKKVKKPNELNKPKGKSSKSKSQRSQEVKNSNKWNKLRSQKSREVKIQ